MCRERASVRHESEGGAEELERDRLPLCLQAWYVPVPLMHENVEQAAPLLSHT
jgi:hypothetical protein